MRGIVFDGNDLVLTDSLEVRDPGPGEVLVRMLASGICHSDLNVVDGNSPRPAPIVLGHEGACEVVAFGPGVTSANGLQPGDRSVIATITPCRACRACAAGRLSDCPSAFGTGERPFSYAGVPTGRYANSSTWAEHVVVRAEQLHGIGDLSPTAASLLGCAVSTGYGNVVNVAAVQPAVDERLGGLVGLLEVALEHVAAAGEHLAVVAQPLQQDALHTAHTIHAYTTISGREAAC